MSSSVIKPGTPSKPGQGSFPPTSQSILRDKLTRRSSPDSEALASSDEEGELPPLENPTPPVQPHKPVRRSSWLNETSQPPLLTQRKGSFASSTMSPTASHPSTPAGESGVAGWSTHPALSRIHTGSSAFPWSSGIWNNDSKKDAASRLAEVVPSPTSTVPPGSSGNSFFSESGATQASPGPRDPPNSQIPFAIPLHPTPKAYRSQSYSVGQLEPDAAIPSLTASSILGSRSSRLPHGLHHRPSRPSMLSEMSSEGMLGKVNEDDDDTSSGSIHGSQQHQDPAKTIEMLQRENMMLRQQQQQLQSARLRPRASTSGAFGLSHSYLHQEPLPEESDYAVDDELNEVSDLAGRRSLARRMSEFGAGPFRNPYLLENKKLENVKKGIWQSSLGFGGLPELPQSRRHSFADVPIPTRQASISSMSEAAKAHEAAAREEAAQAQELHSAYPENHNMAVSSQVAPYFTGGSLLGPQQSLNQAAYNQFPAPSHYSGLSAPYSNRTGSPHRNMYGMSQSGPRRDQPLHIVLFKCSRADVFYIQEGTGLTVKPGDLVIVEADRGTDLGTVARDNVDWQTAKELKEHYAEEQYKWLMMYSQNAAAAHDGVNAGLMASSNGLHGSAVGGMGPPHHHHFQDPNAGELKPKLIKRLAQNHEILALREKEGNEARAKRVCQQKVKEHGLDMEILDAEFQMDWKKLTFYYFANTYINFNALVTDLFKIYKTRIWMSAINPASFANPHLGLQAPSGVGPGAVVNRGPAARRQQQQEAQQESHAAYSTSNQPGRGLLPAPYGPERPPALGSNFANNNYAYTNPYAAFGNAVLGNNALGNAAAATAAASRPAGGISPYGAGMTQGLDGFGSSTYQQGGTVDFAARARFPSPQPAAGVAQHDQAALASLGGQGDLLGSFQGLSLNSR